MLSSVCGRRAKVLAGWTRRPGVAIAEGSSSSERRRRRGRCGRGRASHLLVSTGCLRRGANEVLARGGGKEIDAGGGGGDDLHGVPFLYSH